MGSKAVVLILFGFCQISADLLRAAYRWMQILSSVNTVISSPCNLFSACFHLLCLKLTFLLSFWECLRQNCTRRSCSHVCVCVCVYVPLCHTHSLWYLRVPSCVLLFSRGSKAKGAQGSTQRVKSRVRCRGKSIYATACSVYGDNTAVHVIQFLIFSEEKK